MVFFWLGWSLSASAVVVADDCVASSIGAVRPVLGTSEVPVDARPLVILEAIGCDDATVEAVLSADGLVGFEGEVAGPQSSLIVPLPLDQDLEVDTEYLLRAELIGGVDALEEVSFSTGSERVVALREPEIVLGGYASASEQTDGDWVHQGSWIVDAPETPDGLSWGKLLRTEDGAELVRFLPEHSEEAEGVFVPLTFTGPLESSLCVVAVAVDAAGGVTEASAEHCVEFEEFGAGGSCGCSGGEDLASVWLLVPLLWRRRRGEEWGAASS